MLSDEEKKAVEWFREDLAEEKENCGKYNDYKKQVIKRNEKILNLIEKQSKEIEELNKDKYGLEEEVQIQAKQLIEIDGNYISKEESEQKERKAYIKGTNDTHELCNKKWEDKIKAKIEEYKKQQKEEPDAYLCIKVLQSLLEKE